MTPSRPPEKRPFSFYDSPAMNPQATEKNVPALAPGPANAFKVHCHTNSEAKIVKKIEYIISGERDSEKTVWEYAYDPKGHLVEARRNGTLMEKYVYDHKGARIKDHRRLCNDSRELLYDRQGQLVSAGSCLFTWSNTGSLRSTICNGKKTEYRYGNDTRLDTVLLPTGVNITYQYAKELLPVQIARNGLPIMEFGWKNTLQLTRCMDRINDILYVFEYDENDDGAEGIKRADGTEKTEGAWGAAPQQATRPSGVVNLEKAAGARRILKQVHISGPEAVVARLLGPQENPVAGRQAGHSTGSVARGFADPRTGHPTSLLTERQADIPTDLRTGFPAAPVISQPPRPLGGRITLTVHTDQIGSVHLLTTLSGEVVKRIDYDSFGNVMHDSRKELYFPLGFAGGLSDPFTGFTRFGFRDYDPNVGRFTAPDPLGDTGGDHDLYDYCVDDPVSCVDPMGLITGSAIPPRADGSKQSPGLWETFFPAAAIWNTNNPRHDKARRDLIQGMKRAMGVSKKQEAEVESDKNAPSWVEKLYSAAPIWNKNHPRHEQIRQAMIREIGKEALKGGVGMAKLVSLPTELRATLPFKMIKLMTDIDPLDALSDSADDVAKRWYERHYPGEKD